MCGLGSHGGKNSGVGGVWGGHGERLSVSTEEILAHRPAPQEGKVATHSHCLQWEQGAVDLDQVNSRAVARILGGSPQSRQHTFHFIPASHHFLTSRRIHVEEARVQGAAEAFLHELKSVKRITDRIKEIYDIIIGDDHIKIIQLCTISDYWRGIEED